MSSADIHAALFSTNHALEKKECSKSASDLKKCDAISKSVSATISKGENTSAPRKDNKSGISKGFLLNQKKEGGGKTKIQKEKKGGIN